MSVRVTKFGVEALGKPFPIVLADSGANTVYPLAAEEDWSGEFSVETIWQTAISASQTQGSEEREGKVSRPTRVLNTFLRGLDRTASSRLLINAFTMGSSRTPIPIQPDFTITTNSDDTTILCDTRYKRFFPGQRIAVVPQSYGLLDTSQQAQIGTISYLTPDKIVLAIALSEAFAIGDIVLPLIDCNISATQELNILTDGVSEWTQQATEYSGQNTLPGLSDEDVRYLGFSYFNGYPIFGLTPNWREQIKVAAIRDGDQVTSGTTSIFSANAPTSYLRFSGTFEDYDRRSIWRAHRFFDSRRGRLRPFWGVNPLSMFEIFQQSSPGTVVVNAAATAALLTPMIEYVVAYDAADVMSVHHVSSFEDVDASYMNINLDDSLPDTAIALTGIHLCRFDQDNLKQIWTTDGVCRYDLAYRSLIDEAAYAVT